MQNGRIATATFLAFTMAAAGAQAAQRTPLAAPALDRSRGEEEQIRKREEWFVLSRGLDQVARPDRLRAQAVRELAQRQRERADTLRLRGEAWESLGPASMTMLTWVMGPVSGRVVALAVHPSNEDVLYLGAASGGMWKTVDGGGSWTPVFDSVGTLSIGALALEASNPNAVWVGTGERQSSCSTYFGLGLYRSPDGGATFEARNGTAPGALELSYIASIALHPADPQTLLVSGDAFCLPDGTRAPGGVFKSTDGGASWRRVLSGTGSDVIYEPGNPSVVYAAMSGDAIYKSTDGGESWLPASTGIVVASRMRLAMAPSNAQTLYALTSGSRLYRTDNGAATWTQVNGAACEGQCTYNLVLDVHPTDPNTIVVGTIRFSKSTNGGVTLTPLTTTWGSAQKVHQDIHVVRFSRTNGQRFWVGGDGGLWRTDDGGTNYTNLNATLTLTQFYDVTIDPSDPTLVFGGAQDNSSSRRSGSQQWNVTVVTGDGFVNVVDPAMPNVVFQTSYPSSGAPSVYRSMSGGAPGTFQRLATFGIGSGEPFPWVTPLAIKPYTIFVASNYVYRGATSQATNSFTWTKISGNLSSSSVAILVLSPYIDITTPWAFVGDIWVGTGNGRIQRTGNALAETVSWTDVSGNFPVGGYVSDIAVDPYQPQRVFATRGAFGLSRLYRSTTGGTVWTAVGGGLPNVPANAVAVDPLDGSRVFVGTDVGVYESTDGGDTFQPFSLGLPLGAVVTDLEIDDSPHALVAGTYGRGAFLVNLLDTADASLARGRPSGADGIADRRALRAAFSPATDRTA